MSFLIDDFQSRDGVSALGTQWEAVSDQVMGGVSVPNLRFGAFDGRQAGRLTGDVRLDTNGGFLQMALSLAKSGDTLDASAYRALQITVKGNGEEYGLHLRTTAITRPWQSYRNVFLAPPFWTVIDLPFARFQPHRLSTPFDPSRLTRLGIVAIGRAFSSDIAVSRIELV